MVHPTHGRLEVWCLRQRPPTWRKKYRDGDPKSVDTEIDCIPSVVAFCIPFLTTRKEGFSFSVLLYY